jgi:hypothetical protein
MQNSRDRRMAQFTCLERRVAELEEENRRLRARMHVAPPSPAQVPNPGLSSMLEDHLRAEREHENQVLKARIPTLERSETLADQGLPTGHSESTA